MKEKGKLIESIKRSNKKQLEGKDKYIICKANLSLK